MPKWTHLRMRFPPFDAPSHIPKEMDYVDVCWPTIESDTKLSLGDENGWFIHRDICDSKPNSEHIDPFSSPLDYDINRLLASRNGWALSPNSLHSLARKSIPYGVVILIFAIILHVLEPVLVNWGVMPNEWAGSISLGLLDYPILFVMATPFVMLSLLFRLVANVIDIRRQHKFIKNMPPKPKIDIASSNTNDKIKFSCNLPQIFSRDKIRGYVRVGLLPPHRDALMLALEHKNKSRPPVGLSTSIPKGWMPIADDGSGIGEATPMVVGSGSSRLFQEPMRIQDSSQPTTIINGSINELKPPEQSWPSSEYGPFVNINWELVIEIHSSVHGKLFWIEKLNVQSETSTINTLSAQTGRLETE